MAQPTDPNALNHFGNSWGLAQMDMGTEVPSPMDAKKQNLSVAAEQKKQAVQENSIAKMATMGTPEQIKALATSHIQGNELTAGPEIKHLLTMSPSQLNQLYGPEVAQNAHKIAKAYLEVNSLKERERTGAQVAKDAALDTAGMAVNTLGGAAVLAGAVADAGLGLVTDNAPAIAPTLSQGLATFNKGIMGAHSDLYQERAAQHALEGSLDQMDSEAQYQRELAAGENDGPLWSSETGSKAKKLARDFGNAIANYGDDPIMAGSLVPEGIGSLIPTTAAIKALGGGARVAMMVMAATEGGSAISQVQQEILAMPEEELRESPAYRALIAEGRSPDEARIKLAQQTGTTAGAVAVPLAAAFGKVSAKFAANPLKSGAKVPGAAARAKGVGTNLLSETVEETGQGASSQFAGNVAKQTTAGLDVSLDEGVGTSAGEGALGGIAAAGALQAPGAALGLTKDLTITTANGVSNVVRARLRALDEQADDASVVGSKAQAAAAETLDVGSQALSNTAKANQTTPQQELEAPATSSVVTISEQVKKAVTLDAEESAQAAAAFPQLEELRSKNPEGTISRAMMILTLGKPLLTPETDKLEAVPSALTVLSAFDEMRKADSTEIQNEIAALPEGHEARKIQEQLTKAINILESSGLPQKAMESISNLTPEEVSSFVDMTDIEAGNLTTPAAQSSISFLSAIGKYNPAAAEVSLYTKVLNQLDGTEHPLLESFTEAKDTATALKKNQESNSVIDTDRQAAIDMMTPEEIDREMAAALSSRPSKDEVGKQIHETYNGDNGKLSVVGHRRVFMSALASGNIEKSQDALSELRNFAQSLMNKVGAFNKSAEGKRGQQFSFQAWGNDGFFEQTKYKPYIQLKSPNSVAYGLEAYADAGTVVDVYNRLLNAYGDKLGTLEGDLSKGALELPALHKDINWGTVHSAVQAKDPAAFTDQKSNPDYVKPITEETAAVNAELDAEATPVKPERHLRKDAVVKTKESLIDYQDDMETKYEPSGNPNARLNKAVKADKKPASPQSKPQDPVDTDDGGAVEDAAKTTPLDKVLDLLIVAGKAGQQFNQFLRSFKRKEGASILLNQQDPAAFLLEHLNDFGNIDSGSVEVGRDLTEAQQKELKSILSEDMPALIKKLNATANTVMHTPGKAKGEATPSPAEGLKKGWLVLLQKERPSANFLVQKEDGSFEYQEKVAQAAIMAGLEWMFRQNTRVARKLEDRDILSIFGQPTDGRVTPAMRAAVGSGVRHQTALDDISNTLEKLLGVTSDKSVSTTYTQGITRSMAADVLNVLEEITYLDKIQHISVTVPKSSANPNGIYTYLTIPPFTRPKVKTILDTFKGMPDVFSRAFIPDREKERFVGLAPTKVSATQIRNQAGKLSQLEREVIKRLQKTEHKLNIPMINLVNAIGEDNLKMLLGFKDTEGKKLNVHDKVRIESKNKSLTAELEGFSGYLREASEFADANKIGIEDALIYFDWRISTVGRLQQQGPVTPQGSKIVRELITATNAVVDLSNPEHMEEFWLAVGQSIGVKVEKLVTADSADAAVAEAKALIKDNKGLSKAVELVGSLEADSDAFVQAIQDSGLEVTMKLIHAVQAVAAHNAAVEKGQSSFDTSLALEADGVTDGPINAVIHMSIGEFTAEEIEILNMGGLYFTDQPTTLADFKKGNPDDLYTKAAALFQQLLAAQTAKDGGENLSLFRLMDTLLDDFGFDTSRDEGEQFEVGRSVTKNPLTVFLYGSGTLGIAGKITSAVESKLYEIMSEVAESGLPYTEHPAFNGTTLEADLKQWLNLSPNFFKDAEKASVGDMNMKEFSRQIVPVFAEPMTTAIDEVTGGLAENMKLTQRVSQIQALVFTSELNSALERKRQQRLKEKKLFGSQLLSEDDMQEALAETIKLAPIYDTDAQSFHIVSTEKSSSDTVIGMALKGNLSTGATTIGATNPSVKVSAYMTIGTGDGRMILNIYANADGSLDASLPVFDGVEQAVGNAKAGSAQINENVHRGWMEGNIYQSLTESLDRFILSLDKDLPYPDSIQRQLSVLVFDSKDMPGVDINDIANLRDKMQDMADDSKARKLAIDRMHTQNDHMSGAGAPFSSPGVVTDDVLGTLNTFRKEELKKIQSARADKQAEPHIQAPDPGIVALVGKLAALDVTTGARHMSGSKIPLFVKSINGFTQDQSRIFKDILVRNNQFAGYNFVFGTAEQLEAYRDANYRDMEKRPIKAGQMDPVNKVAFIQNHSPETMLHEILHMHTIEQLAKYYNDKNSVPVDTREAVVRLEQLMKDFREMTFSDVFEGKRIPRTRNRNEAHAAHTLQVVLNNLERDKVGQMTEFLSWSLSNQHLMDLGKKTKVYSPVVQVMRKVLTVLKRFWGVTSSPGLNMFTNIRFNADVLISSPDILPQKLLSDEIETSRIMDQVYGANPAIETIERKYLGRLNEYLSTITDTPRKDAEVDELRRMSRDAVHHAVAEGYHLDARAQAAFQAVHMALMSNMQVNPSALAQANRLYGHVLENIKRESFLDDPATATLGQKAMAKRQHDALVESGGFRNSASHKSDLLATFMALGIVDPTFRDVLAKIPAPHFEKSKIHSVDDALRAAGNAAINTVISQSVAKGKHGKTVAAQIDTLSHALTEVVGERRLMATSHIYEGIDKANGKASKLLEKASDIAGHWLETKGSTVSSDWAKGTLASMELIVSLGSKKASAHAGDGITFVLNQSPNWSSVRSLVSDIRGQTADNIDLVKLINLAKAKIDALRQDYREKIPANLKDAFSEKLSKQTWHQFYQAARTDLASLGRAEALALLADPASVTAKIRAEETTLASLGGSNTARYKGKSKVLAHYLNTREITSKNMHRNAHAIAKLLEENVTVSVTPELVASIDRLVTLYAFEGLDAETKSAMESLSAAEKAGVELTVGYMHSTRLMEISRIPAGPEGDVSRNNGWKGHMPMHSREGTSLIIRDDSDSVKLQRKGYTRIGDYLGDPNERYAGTRGLYLSSVGGKNTFRQGIAQTVHSTWQGVDSRNGETKSGDTDGTVQGNYAKRIRRRIGRDTGGVAEGLYLLPIYGADDKIAAYELPMDSEQLAAISPEQNLADILGVWSGRILEEGAADAFNKDLIGVIKKNWDNRKPGSDNEYVNVADKRQTDAVIKDAWGTLGWKIKEDAAVVFGRPNFFPVRRDMADDAIGFRAASLTDSWTGVTRWNPKIQKVAVKAATLMMGNSAFEYISKGEGAITDAVSYAKTTIIIRSLVVARDNIFGNYGHLALLGVSLGDMLTGSKNKFIEITEYVKNNEEILRLTVRLASDITNKGEVSRIKARIRSLEDVNKSLSIQPLIEAGEFSTISESLTEADLAIREGKLSEYLEKSLDKLPGFAKTLGKNVLITKDTELFQGLNRMVQYGDFVAKAILYDHLTKKKGADPKEALTAIAEEFVNYNRLSGRGRDYLESVGLLWFYNYKLRITKIAVKAIRERPLSALMMVGFITPPLGLDNVVEANIVGTAVDGSIDYSWGTEMGRNAWSTNPWYNLMN